MGLDSTTTSILLPSLRFSSFHTLPMDPLLGGQRSLGSLSESAEKQRHSRGNPQWGTEVTDKCPGLHLSEGQISFPTSTLPTTPPWSVCLLTFQINHLSLSPFLRLCLVGENNYNTFDPSNWITDVISMGLTSSHLIASIFTQFWLFSKFVLKILELADLGDRDWRALRKLFLFTVLKCLILKRKSFHSTRHWLDL